MVALFSRAVIQRTGPYGEALEKQLEPPIGGLRLPKVLKNMI
jgi:hypothetical protein